MEASSNRIVEPAKGRPLGYAVAWLLECHQATHALHMAYEPTPGTRLAARLWARGTYGDAFENLEVKERPQDLDEGEEPELLP